MSIEKNFRASARTPELRIVIMRSPALPLGGKGRPRPCPEVAGRDDLIEGLRVDPHVPPRHGRVGTQDDEVYTGYSVRGVRPEVVPKDFIF